MSGIALKLCPACSLFRYRHSELSEHLTVRPLISRGRGSQKYFITGCHHARPVFGPHETEEAAQQAWEPVAADLRTRVSSERLADLEAYETRAAKLGLAE